MTSSDELALLRIAAQRLAGPRCATATEAVRWLTCVQGQELPGAVTSVALRTASLDRADVLAALDAGEVVRSWPMRGTLHLVAADDLPWLLELLTPRAMSGIATRLELARLTLDDLESTRDLAVAVLRGGGRMGRAQLLASLAERGALVDGPRGYHSLWFLCQTGALVLGPTGAAGDQEFVLLEEWAPSPRRLAREEALGELVLRYFNGHGPATVADLVRWAHVLVREVKAGLALVRDQLAAVTVDGMEHLMDPETPGRLAACRDEAMRTMLLPGFDELVLGYADRSCTVPSMFADQIVPGNNGVFRPTVVTAGRAVATWRATGKRRTITVEPFTTLDDAVATALPLLAATPAWP